MTPKEGLALVWAQQKLIEATKDGKGDVERMAVMKEAFEDAMTCLGFSVYFDEEE